MQWALPTSVAGAALGKRCCVLHPPRDRSGSVHDEAEPWPGNVWSGAGRPLKIGLGFEPGGWIRLGSVPAGAVNDHPGILGMASLWDEWFVIGALFHHAECWNCGPVVGLRPNCGTASAVSWWVVPVSAVGVPVGLRYQDHTVFLELSTVIRYDWILDLSVSAFGSSN